VPVHVIVVVPLIPL